MSQAARIVTTPAEIVTGFAAIGCRLELLGRWLSIPLMHKPRDDARWDALNAAIAALPNGARDIKDYMRHCAQ